MFNLAFSRRTRSSCAIDASVATLGTALRGLRAVGCPARHRELEIEAKSRRFSARLIVSP
jgi:hypothetical protein